MAANLGLRGTWRRGGCVWSNGDLGVVFLEVRSAVNPPSAYGDEIHIIRHNLRQLSAGYEPSRGDECGRQVEGNSLETRLVIVFMPTQTISVARGARHPGWLLTGFWICVVIAVAVVVRRMLALLHPSAAGPPPMVKTDAVFASHAALTMAHIVPACLFVLVAIPVLFRARNRGWLQWIFFVLGAVTGFTAYAMDVYAIGGWIERSAVLVFDTWFLISLARALWFYVENDPRKQREWTSRAVAILLGIATTRPVMGVFFATSRLTHLTPNQFFGIAFWIGFSINAVAIELWLRSKRRTLTQLASVGNGGV